MHGGATKEMLHYIIYIIYKTDHIAFQYTYFITLSFRM